MIKVDDFNLHDRTARKRYLPHCPVLNPNKPGKVRRVLNGAAKFHGKSLNSCLLTGPDLLQDLFNVLLRFRQHPYAVSADIEGMFLQVGVPTVDQSSLRFLWREDPTKIWMFFNIRGIFSVPKIPPPVRTLLCSKPLGTIRINFLKLPRLCSRSFIWMIT